MNPSQSSLAGRAQAPIDFIAVTPGSEELLGIPAGWEGVRTRLLSYSLVEVLDLLGRISILLDRAEDMVASDTQAEVLAGLFGTHAPVWKNLEKFEREHEGHAVVLFHGAQIANAVKAAILTIPADHRPTIDDRPDHRRLGQALFIINKLISDEHVRLSEDTSEAPSHELELYVLANGIFYAGDAGLQDFARASELYLRDREALHNVASYRNLAADIKDLTGNDPAHLWAIFFAFYSSLGGVTRDEMPTRGSRLTREYLFSNLTGFSSDQVDAFFSLVSQDLEDLQAAVSVRYSWENFKPLDFVALARRPLVRIGDEYFLLGLRFLKEKLTTGLHHLFLDPETGFRTEKERKSYLTFMGYVWEDYVRELLERAYGNAVNAVLINEDEVKPRVMGKSIDAVLLIGDTALLIESKATLFTIQVRAGADWEGYQGKLQDLVFDAAAQLDRTISAIEDGSFTDVGINPDTIRRYLPLVASLEPAIMNPLLSARVKARLAADGLLQGPRTAALQILDPSELELLEIGAESGRPMHALLEQKADDINLSGVSFRNFLVSRADPVLGEKNTYLAGQFRTMTQQAMDFIRTHANELFYSEKPQTEET